MNHNLTVADIFSSTDNDLRIPLEIDVETAYVVEARKELEIVAEVRATKGASAANRVRQPYLNSLIWQYIPALRKRAAEEGVRASHTTDLDEVRANVLMGFVEAVRTVRLGTRVVAVLSNTVMQATDTWGIEGTNLNIPARQRSRYFQITREAGSIAAGVEVCGEYEMSRQTYLAAADALGECDSLDVITEIADAAGLLRDFSAADDISNWEDRFDAELALATLEDGSVEKRIVRLAYGFELPSRQSDEDIAELLREEAQSAIDAPSGDASNYSAMSRRTVARKRDGAVRTMHSKVCAGDNMHLHCLRDHEAERRAAWEAQLAAAARVRGRQQKLYTEKRRVVSALAA